MRSWFAAVRDLAAPRMSRDGSAAEVPHEEEAASAEGRELTIRAMLERIMQSPEFNATPRSRKFLTYVVEEILAGRAERIKAYSIATDVFGRGADFDAHSDPIVRLEAGRLRRALEQYYQQAGGEDPVAISIPKGGYIPQFRRAPRKPSKRPLHSISADRPSSARLWPWLVSRSQPGSRLRHCADRIRLRPPCPSCSSGLSRI